MGVVEVWRESSGFWRWRYTEPPPAPESDPIELLSNEVYESRQEAVRAATTAYPGVPVVDLDRPPGAPAEPAGGAGAGRARLRRRMLVLLGVTLAFLALQLRRRRRHAGTG